jgi:hypothetical protein
MLEMFFGITLLYSCAFASWFIWKVGSATEGSSVLGGFFNYSSINQSGEMSEMLPITNNQLQVANNDSNKVMEGFERINLDVMSKMNFTHLNNIFHFDDVKIHSDPSHTITDSTSFLDTSSYENSGMLD